MGWDTTPRRKKITDEFLCGQRPKAPAGLLPGFLGPQRPLSPLSCVEPARPHSWKLRCALLPKGMAAAWGAVCEQAVTNTGMHVMLRDSQAGSPAKTNRLLLVLARPRRPSLLWANGGRIGCPSQLRRWLRRCFWGPGIVLSTRDTKMGTPLTSDLFSESRTGFT